jgi:NAD-dependent DNA ligase
MFKAKVLQFVQRLNPRQESSLVSVPTLIATTKTPATEPTPKDENGQPVIRHYNEARRIDRAVNELLGLLRGVLADGVLTPQEVLEIGKWLLRNREAAEIWPVNVVANAVAAFLTQGGPTRQDCVALQQLFVAVTGPEADLEHARSTKLPLTNPAPAITFPGRVFLFTGRFEFGSRDACETEVNRRGGTCVKSISKKVDYAVIGNLGGLSKESKKPKPHGDPQWFPLWWLTAIDGDAPGRK